MSVPNNNSFELQDVIDEVQPSGTQGLQDCFDQALDYFWDLSRFDPCDEISPQNLLNFRRGYEIK